MDSDLAVNLGQQALTIGIMIAAPMLIAALIVGVFIGMFQATTQINEQTLSFVPKIGAMAAMLLFVAPWMVSVLTDYMRTLFVSIPGMLQ